MTDPGKVSVPEAVNVWVMLAPMAIVPPEPMLSWEASSVPLFKVKLFPKVLPAEPAEMFSVPAPTVMLVPLAREPLEARTSVPPLTVVLPLKELAPARVQEPAPVLASEVAPDPLLPRIGTSTPVPLPVSVRVCVVLVPE